MATLGHHPPALPAPISRPSRSHVQPCSLPAASCQLPAPQPRPNNGAVPLEAPRGPFPEHPAHNDPQVVTRHLHPVTRANLQQAAQPAPPPAARLANVRKRPFHLLAAELLEPFAPTAAYTPPIVAVGALPFRRLVRPHPFPRTMFLGGKSADPPRHSSPTSPL